MYSIRMDNMDFARWRQVSVGCLLFNVFLFKFLFIAIIIIEVYCTRANKNTLVKYYTI